MLTLLLTACRVIHLSLHSPPPPSGSDKASFHFIQLSAADFKKLLEFMCHTLFNHLILRWTEFTIYVLTSGMVVVCHMSYCPIFSITLAVPLDHQTTNTRLPDLGVRVAGNDASHAMVQIIYNVYIVETAM